MLSSRVIVVWSGQVVRNLCFMLKGPMDQIFIVLENLGPTEMGFENLGPIEMGFENLRPTEMGLENLGRIEMN